MFSALSTALSALTADSTAISVTGNNLANLDTVGFKASDVQFSDLMSQALNASASSQVGLGVGPIQTTAVFTQGAITTANGPLDSAIQGNGFFVVKDPTTNSPLYTRDGSFQLDANGDLVTSTGQFVQGWGATNSVVNATGAPGNIVIPVGSVIQATPTSNVSLNVNLNSQVATTDPGATFSAPIQIYDSQGSAHTATITFNKTAVNTWSYSVGMPASDFTTPPAAPLATGTLTFDGNGNLTAPAPTDPPVAIKITGLADGASDMSVNWNMFDAKGNSLVTQLAQTSGLGNEQQDGSAAGQLTQVAMSNGGLIVASYSNGQQATVGQLALAAISNPQSLLSVGNNNLQASSATAPPAIGAPNTGGRGQVLAGSLESSTADIATEFTNLITLQQAYEANSKIVTTVDQLTQTTISIMQP